MNNIELPFSIGTYLITEDEMKHIDKVEKYVINQKGMFVVLTYDAISDPRTSQMISIEKLKESWKIVSEDDPFFKQLKSKKYVKKII